MHCKTMTVVNIAVDSTSDDLYFDWLLYFSFALFICLLYQAASFRFQTMTSNTFVQSEL